MGLGVYAVKEFQRSPITVAATVAGVLVSILALALAWLSQNSPQLGPVVSQRPDAALKGLIIANIAIVTACFLASAFSAASVLRLILRSNPLAAGLLSLPAAVLSVMCALVTIRLAPPRPMSANALASASDAVFYGTLIIILAVNIRPLLCKMASSVDGGSVTNDSGKDDSGKDEEAGPTVGAVLLMILLWGACIRAGVSMLERAFLL